MKPVHNCRRGDQYRKTLAQFHWGKDHNREVLSFPISRCLGASSKETSVQFHKYEDNDRDLDAIPRRELWCQESHRHEPPFRRNRLRVPFSASLRSGDDSGSLSASFLVQHMSQELLIQS